MAKINKEYVNLFFDNLDSNSDKEIKSFVENINKEPVSFLNTIFNLYLEDLTKDNILTKLNVFIFINKNNIKINLNNCIELININKSLKEMLSLIDDNNIMTNIRNNILKMFIDAYFILNKEAEENEKFDISDMNYQGSKIYMNEISKYPLLTPEEEKELAFKVQIGDSFARKKLINHNLRLVIKFAHKYVNRGISFEDLVQEGNLGLMKAVEKFDPTLGTRFSTYAAYWIKQSINRAINNTSRNIRIPVSAQVNLNKVLSARNSLETKNGRKPTIDELSEYLEKPINQLEEILAYQNDTISLNSFIGEEETTELGDFIQDDIDIEKDIANTLIEEELLTIIKDILNEDQYTVIFYRYIIDKPYTLEQVGTMLGVTRERVRQIESKALRILRKNNLINKIKDSFEGKIVKGEENNKIVQTKSIYQEFLPYSKEDIDKVINCLLPNEQFILHLKFGNNFSIPKINSLFDIEMEQEYIDKIYPKIMYLLKELTKEAEEDSSNNDYIDDNLVYLIALSNRALTIEEKLTFEKIYNESLFQELLNNELPIFKRIMEYRLGIKMENRLSLNVISTMVSYESNEISKMLFAFLNEYNNIKKEVIKQKIK